MASSGLNCRTARYCTVFWTPRPSSRNGASTAPLDDDTQPSDVATKRPSPSCRDPHSTRSQTCNSLALRPLRDAGQATEPDDQEKLELNQARMTMLKYNLLIVHTPGKQDISDFQTIRNFMLARAPEIRVSILSVGQNVPPDFLATIAELPTLVFSPMPVSLPDELRGAREMAVAMSKVQQIKLLQQANLPVPRSRILAPDVSLSSEEWGELVVTKPNGGQRGEGVRLMRTSNVAYRHPNSWHKDDPRFGKELIVQEWIDTGLYPESYRVMTVLGDVVYACQVISKQRSNPKTAAVLPDGVPIASNDDYEAKLAYDADILDLATRTHGKLNFTSVMGIDIIRDRNTGKPYVLELNPGGWTWHISSPLGKEDARRFALDLYGQFNALDVITSSLIKKTRALAR